jgi:hypothetical protein
VIYYIEAVLETKILEFIFIYSSKYKLKNLLVQTKLYWSCAGGPVFIGRTVKVSFALRQVFFTSYGSGKLTQALNILRGMFFMDLLSHIIIKN